MYHPITRASLNLTRACNLACSYCFTHGCTKGSMTFDTAKKTIDFLFANALLLTSPLDKMVEIVFWGGEPLLEWNLLQLIVHYAKSKCPSSIRLQFSGTTNGTLLTPDKFDFLDENKIFFMVSFDGTPESHNQYRRFHDGRGSHEVIAKNLRLALKRWPFYKVRLGPTAERVDHFFEDVKYIFDLGCNQVMFSPVYEGNWNKEKWEIFGEQCGKIVDYMVGLRKEGRPVEIEHFKTYGAKDASCWPCGAGRFYVGIDIDGAIYPCHRFNKFDDNRPWNEKEVCIGNITSGITRPDFREKFIDFHPQCGECERLKDTPCHGGCYAVNYDFSKDISKPHKELCNYVDVQKKVSMYYKEKIGTPPPELPGHSCVCNNMCYLEGTPEEIVTRDRTGIECTCYKARYTGPAGQVARPLSSIPQLNTYDIALLLDKIKRLENK